jgi:predicted component of type VI protein secretion system
MTRLRRRAWVVAATALALMLAACGNAQERNLCRQYEDLQAAVAQVEALDPETATAADALEIVENVMAQLDQFQAASDGLYDQAISNLNFALTDLRQVTFDLGDEGLVVAQPLMQESLDTSVAAYNALQERLDVVCGTD